MILNRPPDIAIHCLQPGTVFDVPRSRLAAPPSAVEPSKKPGLAELSVENNVLTSFPKSYRPFMNSWPNSSRILCIW